MEEMIGTNLLPKVGIVLLVLGLAYLTNYAWGAFSHVVRALILYASAAALLGCGVFLERKEKYAILGRVLIGGGWSVLFLSTYAINHVEAVRLFSSAVVDLVLMLIVASAMVWHTLKYNSQLVTGVAFLLGFAAVTLNPDPPFNLIAGALLAIGLTVIVVRRQWFELEVFGILAGYLTHGWWLFTVFGLAGVRPFPEYRVSVALMLVYWVTFRTSYLLRKVSTPHQESVSTVAGLLNPILLLAVMRYQSLHHEWAWIALLVMGAVEFTLGQMPASRRRRMPFYILSSLGALLMTAAVPVKYAGHHSREILWLVGAEAFLLAGIFAKERLFRQFSGIISFLVAGYLLFTEAPGLLQKINNGEPHHDGQLSLILALVALVFYVNGHAIARYRKELFEQETETLAIGALSLLASIFAVGAIYSYFAPEAVAIALAVLLTALSALGMRFRIAPMIYQSHWIAAVAFADVCITGWGLKKAVWHGIPELIVTFVPVAGLIYLSSRFVRLSETRANGLTSVLYKWGATALLTLLIFYRAPDWLVAVGWALLALSLALVAQWLERSEFRWQALSLGLLASAYGLLVNLQLNGPQHQVSKGLSQRLVSMTVIAGVVYLLTRWSPMEELKPAYSWAGTLLLGALAYKESPEQWTAVCWIALAACLALAARLWKERALLWQCHLLSAVAVIWMLMINFRPEYGPEHGTQQLIAVLFTAAVFYALTWITDVPEIVGDQWVAQAYSWAGSLLVCWLVWYQRQAHVHERAAYWGVIGLLLFEIGYKLKPGFLRTQGYVALFSSFVYIFFANFNVRPASLTDPGVLLVLVPLVPIYFAVYYRLHSREDAPLKRYVEYLLACIGTAAIAAVAYFELNPDNVALAYAVIAVAALVIAWLIRQRIFLFQSLVMLGVTGFRLAMNNFHNLHTSFSASVWNSVWPILVLMAGIPVAYKLRDPEDKEFPSHGAHAFFTEHPEQPLFFVPVVLMAVLLFLNKPGAATLSWGIEGLVIFVLALIVKERSFRLTGMALLLLCAGKIVVWDVWSFDKVQKILTLIVVGIILLVVPYLYGRNKEALKEYL